MAQTFLQLPYKLNLPTTVFIKISSQIRFVTNEYSFGLR